MGKRDITEKILESYNDVFADIVNVLLFNGEPVIQPDELIDQAPRAAYKADGVIREIERDVAKRWVRGNIRIACIGFENQTEPDPDMPLRIFGYDGAEYRAQLLKENRGNPRYPVVTLVLYFGHEKRWDKPLTLYEAANVPDRFRPFVPDMKINLFEIAFLSREQVRLFKSDFRIVADYFVQKRENGDYIPSPERLDHVQATLQLLSVMTRDRRFEEVYSESAEKGEVRNMCDVLDRVEQRGIAQGMAQGIEQGMAQGIERGIAQGIEQGMARGIEQGMAQGIEQGISQGMAQGMAQGKTQGADEQAKKTAINLHDMGLAPADIARAIDRSVSLVQKWLGVGMA